MWRRKKKGMKERDREKAKEERKCEMKEENGREQI
jgi:hypothetical protein